ncbi:MAG: multidrug efflux RND transporter permease subunit [Gammaproteobacteria bacterium]|nr:multidrug efflux RND transporter permease subunit [Gammaproteobacteria bacterium]
MNISRAFIERPIFAGVLSALIFLAGLIAIPFLPVSEYPDVVPPSIVVTATYPGANPKVIAETVAAPLEEQINGVEGMLYMSSMATTDGILQLTVTFKIGVDPDLAESQVQNRVQRALPRLPLEVRQFGVITQKQSPNLTMVVHLRSPDGRYDDLYLRNYAILNLKDNLRRIPGMGNVWVFGGGDYAMRVWLDPNKLAARHLTASDVVRSLQEQNQQVAAGVIGAPPAPADAEFQLSLNTQGRLTSEAEFGNIIVATAADGGLLRLRDVARIELGAGEYALRSLLDNKPAVAIAVFQAPGSNAVALSNAVRQAMARAAPSFPDGLEYDIVYDPPRFVEQSIREVIKTLLEAIALVVVVVIIFLKTWRASVIPLIAVPISIVGTFGVMLLAGFSINTLTLFGLVLSIGIVVDDAIVVVENVERNIELGFGPAAATRRAMEEVSGPIIAIALTLCAVFVPIAFISGLTGQFYRQFALTIAISTVISAFNSLTLSPALAAVLLRPHTAPKDRFTRLIEALFGWFFRGFDAVFTSAGHGYVNGVRRIMRMKTVIFLVYVGLLALTFYAFYQVPSGFIPGQDKQSLIGFVQLPDAASLDRTERVLRQITDIAHATLGVANVVAFPGLSIAGFTNSANAGVIFLNLDPFAQRTRPELSGEALAQALNQKFGAIQDALIAVFPSPAVDGLGTIGGFKLQLEDRAGLGDNALYEALQAVMLKAWQTPEVAGIFSSFQINVPQLFADIDREKAKRMGIDLNDVFATLQINLGSYYVNDFNRFGKTYRVVVQADSQYRARAEQIETLKTRNAEGEMVPLGSVLTVKPSFGPDRAMRYNAFPAADINGAPGPGFSSGQAQAALEKIIKDTVPNGIDFEWTDLTYQEILAGNTAIVVFPLCGLLVFLVLAALYESFKLPLAIILIVPLCLLFAIGGVWSIGGDRNIFTQIALFVLMGLACKNAILLIEFAREFEMHQPMAGPVVAVLQACRMRLRPILMTSIAFIMGVVPLVTSSGAGAEMRHTMGVAVLSGMVGVTFFGLFLTPLFYVLLHRIPKAGKQTTVAPTEGMT